MYMGKRVKKTNKPLALLASLVLVFGVAVAGTVAFLTTHTGDVVNTFTPGEVPNRVVEDFNGSVKKDVAIENTGNVPAYIRAAVVVTWVDGSGNVYGEVPVKGTDYTWTPGNDGWVEDGGYYYYTSAVAAGGKTGVLFTDCQQINLTDGMSPNQPAGYSLSVEILSQSIQADGMGKDADGNDKTPVELAWGLEAAKLVGAVDDEEVSG